MRFSQQFKDKKIEMAVAVDASPRQGVVIVTGPGVPPRVGVGAPDLPPADWCRILGRGIAAGAYDKVERVYLGMVALDPALRGPGDQSATKGGGTFGIGTGEITRASPPVRIGANAEDKAHELAAWLVTRADGKTALLVVPDSLDSRDLAGTLTESMPKDMEFCIEAVVGGSFLAHPASVLDANWDLITDALPPRPSSSTEPADEDEPSPAP